KCVAAEAAASERAGSQHLWRHPACLANHLFGAIATAIVVTANAQCRLVKSFGVLSILGSLTLPASMRRPALVNCVFDPTIMKVDRQPTGGPTNRSFSP